MDYKTFTEIAPYAAKQALEYVEETLISYDLEDAAREDLRAARIKLKELIQLQDQFILYENARREAQSNIGLWTKKEPA